MISSTRTDAITNKRVAMFEYDFDLNNNMTKFAVLTPHGSNVTQYTYGADNLPATSTFSNGKVLTYSYNTVSQPSGFSIGIDENTKITRAYTYTRKRDEDDTYDKLTDLIKTEVGGGFSFGYVYDEHNNITQIYENVDASDKYNVTGTLVESYEYDYLDQLIEAIDYKDNKKYVYTYDDGGNITREEIYDLTDNSDEPSVINEYEYTDSSWGDKLTSYNEQTINYDDIGNPTDYRDDIDLTWSKGRQLDSYTKGDTNVEYTYDNSGMRLTKTVDGVETTYLYQDGLLVQETRGGLVLDYSYGADGRLAMVKYSNPSQNYTSCFYYALNYRGDVVGLYSESGTLIAKYSYDAWGNVLSVTNANGGAINGANHIANLQPFRYRSYYYDTDSGFYYLQSRYYDPVTHRFINADGLVSTGTGILGHNMFAYCDNNPLNCSDPTGCCGDPTCLNCNPLRKSFVAQKTEQGWYDTVYPDFKPYFCNDTHTTKTQHDNYITYNNYREIESGYKIPSGGEIKLTVIYDIYEDKAGSEYVAIRCVDYSIVGCPNFDHVDIVYGNGREARRFSKDKQHGFYVAAWDPVNTVFAVGCNIDVYLKDGNKYELESNYTNGEVISW